MSEGDGCAKVVREFLKYNPMSSVGKISMETKFPSRIVERTCRRMADDGMLSRDKRFGFVLYTFVRDPIPNCSPLSADERRARKLATRKAYRERVKAGQPVTSNGRKPGRPALSEEERVERRKAHYRRVTAARAAKRRLERLARSEEPSQTPKSPKPAAQRGRIVIPAGKPAPEAPERPRETSWEAEARGVPVERLPAVWERPRRYPAPGWPIREGWSGARVSV